MNVKQLIEVLNDFDQESEVRIFAPRSGRHVPGLHSVGDCEEKVTYVNDGRPVKTAIIRIKREF